MSRLIKKIFFSSRSERVYILPTKDGLKMFSVNIILLVIGLVYANNYLILFNFILLSLFLVAMFYTHLNLQGLVLSSLDPFQSYSGEKTKIAINFKKNFQGNRIDLSARLIFNDDMIATSHFNLSAQKNWDILFINSLDRGIYKIQRIMVETTFPLNLFKSFIFFNCDSEIIIFPRKDIRLEANRNELANIYGNNLELKIRDYIIGDSPNKILWKKISDDKLLVRAEQKNLESGISFNVDNSLRGEELELHLSQITSAILFCIQNNTCYGIATPKNIISVKQNSETHLYNCLRCLAAYEP